MIQKQFINYSLKIKGNNPYPILLIEAILYPIESVAMFRYLMYKKNLYNMEAKSLHKISFITSQTPTSNLGEAGIRMPSPGSTIGG